MNYKKKKFSELGPQFIIVYLEKVSDISKKLNPTEIELLTWMWKDCVTQGEEHHNVVYALAHNKNKWAASIETKVGVIENAITSLVSNGFIKRIGRGVYILNPEYFYKGSKNGRFSSFADYNKHITEEEVVVDGKTNPLLRSPVDEEARENKAGTY